MPIYAFTVMNTGPVQAVNVYINDIVLPMSDETKKSMDEEVRYLEGQVGESTAARRPGWDKWTVVFAPLTSVPVGQQLSIPFRIENMGPLQIGDICFCLAKTVRPEGFGALHIPVLLRFSNRDGFNWVQTYDLEHTFKCRIALNFRKVELVNR